MAQSPKHLNVKLCQEILNFSSHIASSCDIKAVCIHGEYSLGLPTAKSVVQVLVVLHDFQPRLMNYAKVLNSNSVAFLVVDEWVFARDVDRGFLGEGLASSLIFPYMPLIGEGYLHLEEVKLKKRLIRELLQSLVLDFPELSHEFHIKPEYFMYEAMLTRARLFPPMFYTLAHFIAEGRQNGQVSKVLSGFSVALEQLETDGVVTFSGNYVKMSKEFVDTAKGRTIRFTNLLKTGQRALFASLLSIFPQVLNFLSQNTEAFLNFQKALDENRKVWRRIEDPENNIYVPTTHGLAPLTNRTDIKAFTKRVLRPDENAEVKVQNIGGILNDAYMVKTIVDGHERKVAVKRFRDWSNFKWFPLTLWSVGTRSFVIPANSRLERECAMNQLLDSAGFSVPRVLYVSPSQRLIFMEYIEGEELSNVIKRLDNSESADELKKTVLIVQRVGELFARVHSLPVALGDTKPENFMIGKDGEIYMMDFEQASRNGDKVWDVAEFLYYMGHDIPPFVESGRIELLAKSFVKGYLRGGGDLKTIRRAATPKYTKVFSVFTFPHVMFSLSNVCRKAEKPKE